MRIRRRNWIIKRIALGFAVAALVAPAAAQAKVDEGISGQPNSSAEIAKGAYVPFATDFPKVESVQVNGRASGMPSAGLNDYLQARDGIEVARTQTRSTARSSDGIENVRVTPRGNSGTELVSSPGFNWGDAGIGAALALGLVLMGGVALRVTRDSSKPQTA